VYVRVAPGPWATDSWSGGSTHTPPVVLRFATMHVALAIGPDGAERAVIPMQPVVPGSEQAKRFDEIRATQLDGLTKAEAMFCRDVKH
jgi:hypothetical protein